jgi:NHLM bacteriocin system secretion protein
MKLESTPVKGQESSMSSPSEQKMPPVVLRTLPLWVLVVAVTIWAFTGKIPIEVEGKTILVSPRSNISIQSRSSGQVVQVNTRSGETVQVGQVLAILDLPELNDKLASLQRKLKELQSQKQDLTSVQEKSATLQQENLQSQRETIPRQVQAAKQQIAANQQEMAAARQQIQVKQTEIQGYSQRIAQLKERTQLLEPRLASGNKLVEEGALAPLSLDIIQAQRQVQDNDIQITQMQVQSNDAQAKIEQLRSQLIGNQAKEKDLNNQIRTLNAQLSGLQGQIEQLDYETLQADTDRDNEIRDLQREIQNLRVRIKTESKVLSPRSGKILEVAVNGGEVIQAGTRLATLETSPAAKETLGLTFLAVGDAEKVQSGMSLEIVPGVEERERYGGIVAEVVSVAPMASTAQEVVSIVGNEELAEAVTTGGNPVVKVIAKLRRDPNTKSGFQWTTGRGVPYRLPENTLGTAHLVVEKRSLASYLTPVVRKLTGIYADSP